MKTAQMPNEKLRALARYLETVPDYKFDSMDPTHCVFGHAYFLMTGRSAALGMGEFDAAQKKIRQFLEIDDDIGLYLYGCGWYEFGHDKQAAIKALDILANGGNVNGYKPIKYLRPSHAD